jgi:hypothetical protein
MTDERMRRVLWTSVFFNFGGALLFAFPDSLGRLAGMPAPAPRVYTAFIAVMVTLFGATYGWLARQPEIDRPLVAFSALGKTGFFAVVSACWLLGEVPARAVAGAAGDLVFAALFAWWLLGSAAAPAASGIVRPLRPDSAAGGAGSWSRR